MAKTAELPTAEKLGTKTPKTSKTTAPKTTAPATGVLYIPKPGIFPRSKGAPDGYPGGFCTAVIDLLKANKGGLTEEAVREELERIQETDGSVVPKSRKRASAEEARGVIRERTAYFLSRWAQPKA